MLFACYTLLLALTGLVIHVYSPQELSYIIVPLIIGGTLTLQTLMYRELHHWVIIPILLGGSVLAASYVVHPHTVDIAALTAFFLASVIAYWIQDRLSYFRFRYVVIIAVTSAAMVDSSIYLYNTVNLEVFSLVSLTLVKSLPALAVWKME